MNSKQTFRRLLLGLAIASLGVTSCQKAQEVVDSISKQESSSSTAESSSQQQSESSSVIESSSESQTESSTVEESSTDESSTDESSTEESSTEESSTVEESSTDTSSEEPIPEETVFEDFTFNYTNQNMTVWTNENIHKTVAPNAKNISETEEAANAKTYDVFGEYGYYTFVIDSQGFIEYASYGSGAGWGAPTGGTYHNYTTWDRTQLEFYILHEEWAPWPATTTGGKNAWTLYDFVIPQGGFIISGWYNNEDFNEFWNCLFGNDLPTITDITVGQPKNNAYLESLTPKELDKYYLSIGEDAKLHVRERLESEMKDSDGQLEKETVAVKYESTAEDAPVAYESMKDVLAECAKETLDKTIDHIVKGVITSFYANGTVVIEDADGNAITVYGSAALGSIADAKYSVGDTISVTGKLDAYKGLYEIKPAADGVKLVEGFGQLKPVSAIEIDAENVAEIITVANQGKLVKLIKAEVLSINEEGSSKVKLGETEIVLFKADFPENVAVGDCVDITASISVYNIPQLRVDSSDAFSRYFNIKSNDAGVEKTIAAADGEQVTLKATGKEDCVFSKWVKVVDDEEIEVGNTTSIKVTVESDATYKAIYVTGPWMSLSDEYASSGDVTLKCINADAGGDAVAVITQADAKFHTNGAWTGGLFNTSWRGIVIVDAEGKIAYAVSNPANGYGGPSATSYITVYDDYTQNPAINLLEGYGPWSKEDATASTKFELQIPEGGFAITSHGSGNSAVINAILGVASWDKSLNSRQDVSNVRVYLDEAGMQVKVYKDVVADNEILVQANIYTHDSGNISLGDFTIALDEVGKIIFASRTSDGFGGPADGFYHDGTYKCVAGQVCGIYSVMSDFAGWPAKLDLDEDGTAETPAWCRYTVVCPEGYTIITGSEEQMLPIVNKVLGLQLTTLGADNTLFEVTAQDGAYNLNRVSLASQLGKNKLTSKVLTAKDAKTFANIYTSETTNIELGDFTIAYDKNGKIIFASRTSDGYGGPADGFYHDGTYACVAGQVCGIFDVAADFAPWSSTATESTWTRYTVVCPAGVTIVTGSEEQMLPVINQLLGLQLTTLGADNTLFEVTAQDGAYNDFVCNVTAYVAEIVADDEYTLATYNLGENDLDEVQLAPVFKIDGVETSVTFEYSITGESATVSQTGLLEAVKIGDDSVVTVKVTYCGKQFEVQLAVNVVASTYQVTITANPYTNVMVNKEVAGYVNTQELSVSVSPYSEDMKINWATAQAAFMDLVANAEDDKKATLTGKDQNGTTVTVTASIEDFNVSVNFPIDFWRAVSTEADLVSMNNRAWANGGKAIAGNYMLTNDIVMANTYDAAVIGTQDKTFIGNFNGNGYTISNLKFANNGTLYKGLFCKLTDKAHVYNLGVEAEFATSNLDGAIAGWAQSLNGVVIENCYAKATLSLKGGNAAFPDGAIVGRSEQWNVSIKNCYSEVTVVDGQGAATCAAVGGIIGRSFNGSVTNGYTVTTSDKVQIRALLSETAGTNTNCVIAASVAELGTVALSSTYWNVATDSISLKKGCYFEPFKTISVEETANVVAGKTITLKPTTTGVNVVISYASDNEDVATVDANGVVTGVAAGTANITCTINGTELYDVCVVTVAPAPVANIAVANDEIALTVFNLTEGDVTTATLQPQLKVDGVDTAASYEYSVNNDNVSVDENGLVTALKAGTAIVTISCQYDESTVTTEVTFTVTASNQTSLTVTAGSYTNVMIHKAVDGYLNTQELAVTIAPYAEGMKVKWATAQTAFMDLVANTTDDKKATLTGKDQNGTTVTVTASVEGFTGSATFTINFWRAVSTEADLVSMNNRAWANSGKAIAGNYMLTNDIVMANTYDAAVVGTQDKTFIGEFNGNGYTISNLKFANNTTLYKGLFCKLTDKAHVYNLGVDVEFATSNLDGGIAGWAQSLNGVVIENCYVKATLSLKGGNTAFPDGAIVGRSEQWNVSIKNCYSEVTVVDGQGAATCAAVGGIIGRSFNGSVVNGYVVTSSDKVQIRALLSETAGTNTGCVIAASVSELGTVALSSTYWNVATDSISLKKGCYYTPVVA